MTLVNFSPRGATIIYENYCDILRKLHQRIQNKGIAWWVDKTARSYPTIWLGTTWSYLSYSTNRASSDCHLFLNFKKHLGGKHHYVDNTLKMTVNQWLSNQTAELIWVVIYLHTYVCIYKSCANISWKYLKIHPCWTTAQTSICRFLNLP